MNFILGILILLLTATYLDKIKIYTKNLYVYYIVDLLLMILSISLISGGLSLMLPILLVLMTICFDFWKKNTNTDSN